MSRFNSAGRVALDVQELLAARRDARRERVRVGRGVALARRRRELLQRPDLAADVDDFFVRLRDQKSFDGNAPAPRDARKTVGSPRGRARSGPSS